MHSSTATMVCSHSAIAPIRPTMTLVMPSEEMAKTSEMTRPRSPSGLRNVSGLCQVVNSWTREGFG